MKQKLLFICLISLGVVLNAQTTVNFNPSKDNTLYESIGGTLSNGAGQFLFSGRTNQTSGNLRRTLLKFDLSSLPANITIDSAILIMYVNNQKGGTHIHNIHVVTQDWGESISNAGSPGGSGTTAATGDATWLHAFSATQRWATAGGDYNPISSDTTAIFANGNIEFTSTQITDDVQRWVDSSNTNHGWIIIGDESVGQTAKRFASKENAIALHRPRLTITYSVTGITETPNSKLVRVYPNPAEDYLVIENRKNIFRPNVIIYDVKGQEVLNQQLKMDNRINISNIKPGVYFIELFTADNQERIVKKIVKQ